MRTLLLLWRFGLILGSGLLLGVPVAGVTMDWVPIGNPGNPADTQVMNDGTTGYGSVPYVYQIGKYDVTIAQYVEFLNAVARSDPNGLWNTSMDPASTPTNHGGITRSGGSGSYTYNAAAGRGNMPVNNVSFWDATRFANWMQNGQPTGAQGPGTTEDGSYTLTAQGIANNTVTRNPGATIVLTSENEWYKAAYYNALSTSYFTYSAGSNTPITCSMPTATPNSANCQLMALGDETAVGAYTGSPSPYGTFDQGGNVWQWNESKPATTSLNRLFRGGSFGQLTQSDEAATQRGGTGNTATSTSSSVGFRLVMVPEPGTGLLVIAGLLGLAGRRRVRP
jgi:sulfatase modifying factor 1